MKVEVKIDNSCTEPLCIIITNKLTDEISSCVERLSSSNTLITGRQNDNISLIEQKDIINIYAAQSKVYVVTERGEFVVKQRLYELDQMLDSHSFVRISNSEIINLHKAVNFNLKLSGTILVLLPNGKETYVSRRYVTKIKERLGV